MQSQKTVEPMERRGFLKQSLALIVGAGALLLPALAALTVLTDPLRRKNSSRGAIRVTTLDSLPDDNVPRKFSVLASQTDAWNKSPNVPVGAVYLRRAKDGQIAALNVVCPHAGCFVDFSNDSNGFRCPCHNSSFKLDGAIADTSSPSPRGLDSLPVEVHPDGSVWVNFQNFVAGQADKIPVS